MKFLSVLVWAKMPGYPLWPAEKVAEKEETVTVRFWDDQKTVLTVHSSDVFPFCKREEMAKLLKTQKSDWKVVYKTNKYYISAMKKMMKNVKK